VIYVFYALHIIVCLFLILVVLLQQGKGADLSVFGGGSTQTAFGARGAATLLHKLTVASFVIFIVTTMGIAILKGGGGTASSVMSDVERSSEAPAEPATSEDTTPATDAATTPEASEGGATDGGGAVDGGGAMEDGGATGEAGAMDDAGGETGGDASETAPDGGR
jgi:preprotein translocase subunit SecG